jgi:Domain of unknown function (DUF1995)
MALTSTWILFLIFCSYEGYGYGLGTRMGCYRRTMSMSLQGKTGFLFDKDQNTYLTAILRKSVESCKLCIEEGSKLIELEFPANRKNDLSLGETLDTNRQFTRQFVEAFASYGKDLWILFPDKKECFLAREKWGKEELFFTMTSIEALLEKNAPSIPQLMVIINPGFSVDEWINIPKLDRGVPMIIINGNLDRLRNGYYPWFIYPALTKVTKEFYSKAVQAVFLSPIAVGGSRLGAWLTRIYPGQWEVLVKGSTEYDVVSVSDKEPEAKVAWQIAKKNFLERTGQMF